MIPSNPGTAAGGATGTTRRRRLVLLMLLVAYTFNFLDRQILGILKEPIKAELGLSDTQLGLMGGLAFALLYSTLAVPIAWLADRVSRTWIITAALASWSAFTMLCGVATGFWSLFLARVGVGLGEAGGVAPAYSLIADYFPRAQRARALAVYSWGVPLGSGAGIMFGGLMAAWVDWRWALLLIGGAGVLFAPLFKWVVRDPVRGGLDGAEAGVGGAGPTADAITVPFRTVATRVANVPAFWMLALGAACSSICGYGLGFWLPSYFMRSLGFTLSQTSVYYGSIQLLGGMAGIWLGGAIADRLGAQDRGAYARTPAVCYAVALPLLLLAMHTTHPVLAWLLFVVPTGLNLAWMGPVMTAVQHLVPAHMRSTTSALFLLVVNLLGLGMGLWIFGFLSDRLAPWYGAESMRYAITCGLGFYAAAAVLMLLASRHLPARWVDAAA
ncbi:MFS transporter [Gemmatimonas sp.]|jgi:MFS family permease|uniref:spinster family MFS transporter n=1 Tax=Gemmatimonas sp. TaxID=1962908 RepID=UPI0022C90A94|nr:MFS transporter [Gemmatimonas sp.]MCZ8203573.1 MFS transporter [Gemmatimonas sp.]